MMLVSVVHNHNGLLPFKVNKAQQVFRVLKVIQANRDLSDRKDLSDLKVIPEKRATKATRVTSDPRVFRALPVHKVPRVR